jgi:hypothetical protein
MTELRGLLWRLFALLAALLLPLALTSAWLATVVTDTDAYVDTVGPLASDEDVQTAAVDALEGAAVTSVEDATGATLDAGTREQVAAAVGAAVASSEFETVWRAANRTAHDQVVRILEEDNDRQVTRDGRVVVELGPLYESIVKSLDERGIVRAAGVPPIEASVPLIRASDLDRVQAAYDLLDAAGFWVPALWLVLVALTMLAATERGRAAVWLAATSIGGLLSLAVGLLIARGVVIEELGSSTDYDLIGAIWDVLVTSLYWAIGVGFFFCVVVLVLVAVLGRRRAV